ncbi:hypothetical protein Dimus_037226, partial [Dionaea muscipula]
AAAETSSEDEDHSDFEGGMKDSSNFLQPKSVPEEFGQFKGLTMATSSSSSTITPTTAILLCQDAIVDGGHATGSLKLAWTASVNSISSPSVDGCPLVADGVRQMVVDREGGQGGAEEMPMASVNLICSSLPKHLVRPVYAPKMVGEGLDGAAGSLGLHVRAVPILPYGDQFVVGSGGAQCTREAGEVLLPSVVADKFDGSLASVEIPVSTVRSFSTYLPDCGGPTGCGLLAVGEGLEVHVGSL